MGLFARFGQVSTCKESGSRPAFASSWEIWRTFPMQKQRFLFMTMKMLFGFPLAAPKWAGAHGWATTLLGLWLGWAVVLPGLAQPAPAEGEIRLIVRSDDIGFCHTANLACMAAYTQGISRSVEIMAPAPWFPEAVKLLQAQPGYDVGIHLVLTSEWENLRWRPLTPAPSVVDADGYFPPFVWENKKLPKADYLQKHKLNLAEVEAEFRAQIELVKRHLPHASHLSAHMGCNWASPEIKALVDRLAAEYQLPLELPPNAKVIQGFGGADKSPQQKEADLLKILTELPPGTHYLIEHPGYNEGDMLGVGHVGYERVAHDREGVTKAFTSPAVRQLIEQRKIKLISIKEAFLP
jgi:chitin disaccharide deacetylase